MRAKRAPKSAAKNAPRNSQPGLSEALRDYVNREIQNQVDAGTLVHTSILYGNTEADKALRQTSIDAQIQRRIDAGLLVPATCPTPTPA
jgi:hypothetical protein